MEGVLTTGEGCDDERGLKVYREGLVMLVKAVVIWKYWRGWVLGMVNWEWG